VGADVPGAHALLATIEPASVGPALLAPVLDALLKGAGATRGLALDSASHCHPAVRGINPEPAELADLGLTLAAGSDHVASYDRALLARLFRAEAAENAESRPLAEPCLFPLTAGDDTLAWIALERPPEDPRGFASVAAHAASLLAWMKMAEKVREADFELKYRVWELESLYDVGLSIAGTLDLESLADEILMKSVSLLNARSGTLVVRPGALPDGEPQVFIRSIGTPLVEDGNAPDPEGRVLICNRREDRPPALSGAPAEKLLAVPISSDGRPLGLLVVADKENRAGGIDDFGPADARILSLFGNQAAIALENARLHRDAVEKEKMEREIEIAASIQRAILPTTLPAANGILLAAGNRPTRQVGGDFYDVTLCRTGASPSASPTSRERDAGALLVQPASTLLMEAGASDLKASWPYQPPPCTLLGDPQVRHPLPRLRPVGPEPRLRERRAQPGNLAVEVGGDASPQLGSSDRDVRGGAPGREPHRARPRGPRGPLFRRHHRGGRRKGRGVRDGEADGAPGGGTGSAAERPEGPDLRRRRVVHSRSGAIRRPDGPRGPTHLMPSRPDGTPGRPGEDADAAEATVSPF
jgi:hypothetical protein